MNKSLITTRADAGHQSAKRFGLTCAPSEVGSRSLSARHSASIIRISFLGLDSSEALSASSTQALHCRVPSCAMIHHRQPKGATPGELAFLLPQNPDSAR